MTEAPKCEDCRFFVQWRGLAVCRRFASLPRTGQARSYLGCGPKGDLFEPKEGKRDE